MYVVVNVLEAEKLLSHTPPPPPLLLRCKAVCESSGCERGMTDYIWSREVGMMEEENGKR